MKIFNQSTITYEVFGKYKIRKDSNIITTEIIDINPIIIFKKYICNNNVKIYIYNNKDRTVFNVLYRECINYNYITDIIKNRKIIKKINLKEGIYLNNLKPREKIVIEYYINEKCKSMLGYEIVIDESLSKMYLMS